MTIGDIIGLIAHLSCVSSTQSVNCTSQDYKNKEKAKVELDLRVCSVFSLIDCRK